MLSIALPSTGTAGTYRVGPGGSADVQAAVDAVVAAGASATIYLAAGTWRDMVDVPPDAPAMRVLGQGAESTRIVNDHYAARIDPRTGPAFDTYGSATMFARANDFTAEQLTIANDAGPKGQAVALVVDGTRAAFRDVYLLGRQDTLHLRNGGRPARFRDCRIEGSVDYVFGGAPALFEGCTLHSASDGYVTAPSTLADQAHGFIFRNCHLTASPGVQRAYLGRPWRPHGAARFSGCLIEAPLPAVGWHDWGRPSNRQAARFSEHGSRGPAADMAGRVAWLHDTDAPPDDATLMQGWRPFE